MAIIILANQANSVCINSELSTTTGNTRGSGSVDLQTKRSAATQVASNQFATIGGGRNNTASNYDSVVCGGKSNTCSAQQSIVGGGYANSATTGISNGVFCGQSNANAGTYAIIGGGRSNNISSNSAEATIGGGYHNTITGTGTNTVIVGGNNNTSSGAKSTICGGYRNTSSALCAFIGGGKYNTVSATYATVSGGYRGKADKYGQLVHSAGMFSATGDAQHSKFVLRKRTTDNTQSEMFLDNSSARLTLSNDTTWAFDGLLVCRRTDADGTNSAWTVSGVIKRDTNAASTALVGTSTPVLIQQDAGAVLTAVDVTADTTNGSLRFRVTGEAAKTYNFVLYLRTVEVTG